MIWLNLQVFHNGMGLAASNFGMPDSERVCQKNERKALANTRRGVKIVGRGAQNWSPEHANADTGYEVANKKLPLTSGHDYKMKKQNFHYPERTEGTKHARELRERTNQISDQQREVLFDRAMRRIYGGFRVKAAVGAGH